MAPARLLLTAALATALVVAGCSNEPEFDRDAAVTRVVDATGGVIERGSEKHTLTRRAVLTKPSRETWTARLKFHHEIDRLLEANDVAGAIAAIEQAQAEDAACREKTIDARKEALLRRPVAKPAAPAPAPAPVVAGMSDMDKHMLFAAVFGVLSGGLWGGLCWASAAGVLTGVLAVLPGLGAPGGRAGRAVAAVFSVTLLTAPWRWSALVVTPMASKKNPPRAMRACCGVIAVVLLRPRPGKPTGALSAMAG